MATTETAGESDVYSLWAVPPDDVVARLKKLMADLRSEFGGPEFEPHITVVDGIKLTKDDALAKLKSACDGLKSYTATVERVATGTFFYQCAFLLIHPTPEAVETSAHCCRHFGYERNKPYMPHMSILYGDLTDEEKKKAEEKANILDPSLTGLSFPIDRLVLVISDTEDQTCKSWKKVSQYDLIPSQS